jgi:hypothetical protein
VCADFERSGICFDSLYSSLDVPFDYSPDLPRKMETAIRRIYAAFGYETPVSVLKALRDDMARRDTVDFGRLDESTQETVIRAVRASTQDRQTILNLNPNLELLKDRGDHRELVGSNCRVIADQYGKERITTLLCEIYQKITDKPVTHALSKPALLELFLNPRHLFLAGISDG